VVIPDDLVRFLAGIRYERDDREPPDDQRRRAFVLGWNDCIERDRQYSQEALSTLTWQNLGNRLAQRFGAQTKEDPRDLYEILAAQWAEPKGT
jgi:hypothetical protein